MKWAATNAESKYGQDLVGSRGIVDAVRNCIHVVEHPNVGAIRKRCDDPGTGTTEELRRWNDRRSTAESGANRCAELGMDECRSMFDFAVGTDDRCFAVRGNFGRWTAKRGQCLIDENLSQLGSEIDQRVEVLFVDPRQRVIENDAGRPISVRVVSTMETTLRMSMPIRRPLQMFARQCRQRH